MKICHSCGHMFDQADWRCPACDVSPPQRGTITVLDSADDRGEAVGFDPEMFPKLAALEAGNFWFRARNKLILWATKRYMHGEPRILEIGCGTGFVLSAISEAWPTAELVGSELFGEGLSYAGARVPRAELLQLDARNLPYHSHFDLIGAFDVLEHIREDEAVLKQIAKALRPGGLMIITVPQHRWLWSIVDEKACHVRRYTSKELKAKIHCAGMHVDAETSFVTLLLPLMWLKRLGARGGEYDPWSEFRIPNWLNRILEAVMFVETVLIKIGFRLPVGGSRLVVARKR